MGYYKEVGGRKLDGRLLDVAEKAVKGSGDGRVSKADAEVIFAAIRDAGQYTEVEKETIEYIRKHFNWTDHADQWFRSELASWRSSPQMTRKISVADLEGLVFGKEDVLKSEEARATRKHDLQTATAETMADHDDIGLIIRLADGQRLEVTCNFIELEGEFVELKGGHIIPVKAIEKVEI